MRWPRDPLCLLIVSSVLLTGTASAQPVPSALSRRAERVHGQVARLQPGDRISVILPHHIERFGNLLSEDAETFSFHDVDADADVRVRFEEATKVKAGYGGYNSLRGRHTDHRRSLVIGAIVVASLIGLVILAAAND